MKCPKCGKEIEEGESFCSNCGTKVESINEVQQNNTNSVKSEPEVNNTYNTNINSNNHKNNNWIGIVLTAVALAVVIGVSSNNTSSNTSSNKSLVDLPAWNIPELEPVKINENAYAAPEATKLYTIDDLEYKLPDNYKLDTVTSNSETTVYATETKDNEQFIFSVGTVETEGTVEDIFEYTTDWEFDGATIVKENEVKTETINGATWYIKGIQFKSSDDTNEQVYLEYYYSKFGNKIYCISFAYDVVNGKNLDLSNTIKFFNIKQSLRFNQ